jgi:hypothetical protein
MQELKTPPLSTGSLCAGRAPARLWISAALALLATAAVLGICPWTLQLPLLSIPVVLWLGVAFDAISALPAAETRQAMPHSRPSWLTLSDSYGS